MQGFGSVHQYELYCYFQAALNKLQIVFSDKMGFLRTNAEEQVK